MENTNIQWLKTLFELNHMKHIKLEESFNCKWFYFKYKIAYYNPKQAAIAHNLDFKLDVLGTLFNNMKQIKPG